MVDAAAKAAGYTIKAFHSTDRNFTEFDLWADRSNPSTRIDGLFFSATPQKSFGGKEMTLWIRPKRVFRYDISNSRHDSMSIQEAIDAAVRGDIGYLVEDMVEYGGMEQQEAEQKASEAEGSDVFIVSGERYAEHDTEIIVPAMTEFRPSQIKSADPITYDDAGKVIPLSKRFDSSSKDTRAAADSVLYVYDFDGTLVDTGEFKQDRIDDPKPITKNIDALRRHLKEGDEVMVLTARSKAELVRSTLADFGVDTKGLKIVALGDPSNDAKGKYLKKNISDKYSKVVMYDDRKKYLDGVEEALEETGTRFKGVLAEHQDRTRLRASILGERSRNYKI